MHGITPLEYRVLLKVDKLEETVTTKGGVTLYKGFESIEDKTRKEAKQEKATIVAIAQNSFEDWAVIPKVGDRVLIAQFAGKNIKGKDDEWYRLVSDKEIEAIISY